jgi:hypothetical protein
VSRDLERDARREMTGVTPPRASWLPPRVVAVSGGTACWALCAFFAYFVW